MKIICIIKNSFTKDNDKESVEKQKSHIVNRTTIIENYNVCQLKNE